MPVQFAQTASVMVCGKTAYCSGQPVDAVNGIGKQAIIGGSSGVAVPITVQASDAGHVYVWFECIVPTGAVWNAGTWTVRFDITLANANINWDICDICRISSGCVSQATIAGSSVLGINLGSTGVKSTSLGGAGQTPGVGDKVVVMCSFSNLAGTNQQFQFTTDVNIDSPFDPPAPGQDAGRNWMYYNTAVRM